MAPLPEEPSLSAECAGAARAYSGDDVVISGMSGAYPSSYSVMDLSNILYNKVNPINLDHARWNYAHPELPQPIGKIPELSTFDAQFFKVHYRLGNNMDPMSRKLLEQTYAAVYDAGYSPKHLWGKRVGVYIGSCFSETEKACFYVASIRNGFGIAGLMGTGHKGIELKVKLTSSEHGSSRNKVLANFIVTTVKTLFLIIYLILRIM